MARVLELIVYLLPSQAPAAYPLCPMHPCLQSPEIVRLVVRSLWDEHPPDVYAPIVTSTIPASTHGSLAKLARTCRAFQTHALDALWSRQAGVENLLRCMPRSLLSERMGSYGPRSQGKTVLLLVSDCLVFIPGS